MMKLKTRISQLRNTKKEKNWKKGSYRINLTVCEARQVSVSNDDDCYYHDKDFVIPLSLLTKKVGMMIFNK